MHRPLSVFFALVWSSSSGLSFAQPAAEPTLAPAAPGAEQSHPAAAAAPDPAASPSTPVHTPPHAPVPRGHARQPGHAPHPAPHAQGETPTSEPVTRPSWRSGRTKPGDYKHDGLYLRLGIGFGALTDIVGTDMEDAGDADDSDESRSRSRITGIGAVSELALGATVAPNLIFGGGLWAFSTSASSLVLERGEPLPENLQHPRDFALIGPFVDWYFARRPGLHFQAGLGFAMLTGHRWSQAEFDKESVGLGGGLMLGFGYDSWISEEWKLGALLRFTGALLGEREAGETWWHATSTFPALLLTATYN